MAIPQGTIYTIEDIYALPEGQLAELIDGRIYDMTPPNTEHQRITYSFARTISDYIDKKRNLRSIPGPVCCIPKSRQYELCRTRYFCHL